MDRIPTIHIISIFPALMTEALKWGVVGQSEKHNILKFDLINPRDFTDDAHRTVDDRPFGGGDGMVFLAEPLNKAMSSLGAAAGRRVFMSAHGKKWGDEMARQWAAELADRDITLVCGRYGGVDQRFLNQHIDCEISIGDYVLSGGELAALVVIDSLARFLPGVLGNEKSSESDSFADGILEAPQFTRPRDYSGDLVPQVILSGDHKKIGEFRRALAIAITRDRRPDLLQQEHLREWPMAREKLQKLPMAELSACGLGQRILDEIYDENYKDHLKDHL